jgi:hypothetical protein
MRTLWIGVAVLVGVWALTLTRKSGDTVWVHPETGTGPARILRFYASTGAVAPGQAVELCYAVENARTVRISPMVTGQYPTRNYCLQVTPEHTTHFTLMAEGWDGSVAARSITLPVQVVQPLQPERVPSVAGI